MAKLMPAQGTRVWDPFVRIFHWSLVSAVLLNLFVVEEGESLHQWIGYAACALVLARVVWGFIGSKHARFSDFFPTPARIKLHVKSILAGQRVVHDGHNPLGALMMLILMALVLALGVTGFLQTTDHFWGEEWLQDIHDGLGNALMALAALHAAAALIMGRIERTRLIKAMFTGVKQKY